MARCLHPAHRRLRRRLDEQDVAVAHGLSARPADVDEILAAVGETAQHQIAERTAAHRAAGQIEKFGGLRSTRSGRQLEDPGPLDLARYAHGGADDRHEDPVAFGDAVVALPRQAAEDEIVEVEGRPAERRVGKGWVRTWR